MYLRSKDLRFESRVSTVRQNSSNLHLRKFKIAWLHQCIFISVLHLLTLSGRFRFGFGVGYISNTIERSFLETVLNTILYCRNTFLKQVNKNTAICTYM